MKMKMQLSSALVLFLSAAPIISAQLYDDEPDAAVRAIDISVDVTFPDGASAEASPADPVVIVNGILKKVNVAVVNHEQGPIGIEFIGGSLWDPVTGQNVRNLTQRVLSIELPKDQKTDIPYSILVDMHPKDLRFNLEMILRTPEKTLFTKTAYDSIVRVVEQPMSLLDPQLLFLYLILLSGVAGAAYWGYNYWIDSVNPKKKRGSRHAVKPAPAQPPTSAATGVEGKKFDESWIPEYHIKRANSPKVRGKTAK